MNEVQITIRLPAALKQEIEKEAANRGFTAKDFILFILFDYFENMIQE